MKIFNTTEHINTAALWLVRRDHVISALPSDWFITRHVRPKLFHEIIGSIGPVRVMWPTKTRMTTIMDVLKQQILNIKTKINSLE